MITAQACWPILSMQMSIEFHGESGEIYQILTFKLISLLDFYTLSDIMKQKIRGQRLQCCRMYLFLVLCINENIEKIFVDCYHLLKM